MAPRRSSSGNYSEPALVKVILTRFVETEPHNFKSIVQNLTGKDAKVSAQTPHGLKPAAAGIIDTSGGFAQKVVGFGDQEAANELIMRAIVEEGDVIGSHDHTMMMMMNMVDQNSTNYSPNYNPNWVNELAWMADLSSPIVADLAHCSTWPDNCMKWQY